MLSMPAAQWMPCSGTARSETSLPRLMIAPPRARRRCSASRESAERDLPAERLELRSHGVCPCSEVGRGKRGQGRQVAVDGGREAASRSGRLVGCKGREVDALVEFRQRDLDADPGQAEGISLAQKVVQPLLAPPF